MTIERDDNNNAFAQKLGVYVRKEMPRNCPFCHTLLESTVITAPKRHSIINTIKDCKKCKRHFTSIEYYLNHNNALVSLNPDLIPQLIIERNDELIAKRKRREENLAREKAKKEQIAAEKKKREEIEQQKALKIAQQRESAEKIRLQRELIKKQELLEKIITTQKLDKREIEAFKTQWLKSSMSVQELNSLSFIFFVRNSGGILSCVAVSKHKKEKKSIAKGIHIISAESKLARELHSLYNSKRKNVQFEVIEKIDLKKASNKTDPLEKHEAEKVMRENESEHSYVGVKPVYVYFRLTNTCVRNKHHVESLTAETTNAKNGLKIHVNVFHCRDCDKYFINYEALQKYIERGVYPSLPYLLTNDISGSLNDASKLMLYGYRVAEGTLTRQDRQSILSWIIDSGLLSKVDIIKDLQFKVRYNGSKAGNEKARQKWLDDIQFVSRYVKNNNRSIQTKFILRNRE